MCMCAVNPVDVQVNLVIVLLKKNVITLSNVLQAQNLCGCVPACPGPGAHELRGPLNLSLCMQSLLLALLAVNCF